MLQNQFNIPGSTLATWKNNKEKIFEAFQNSSLKRQRVKTWIYKKLLPCWSCLHQCVVATFQSVVLFFWRKLMNLLRPSITTILQHRTDGCSNGCFSLASIILYIVKNYPLLIFSKRGWNNLNSYNSKTHIIRTNFESPWVQLYYFISFICLSCCSIISCSCSCYCSTNKYICINYNCIN